MDRKWILTVWAVLECMFFAGILYGWASLVHILKSEGIYGDLCTKHYYIGTSFFNQSEFRIEFNTSLVTIETNRTSNLATTETNLTANLVTIETNLSRSNVSVVREVMDCTKQDKMLFLCFTTASVFTIVGFLALGPIFIKFGTRLSRMLSIMLFVAGALTMAFVTKENPWMIFLGLSLVGVGGFPLLDTNIQISHLFPNGGSTVVGALNGGYDVSSAIMLLIKVAHENGFSRKKMFILLACLHSMVFVSTFALLPRQYIKKVKENEVECHVEETIEMMRFSRTGGLEVVVVEEIVSKKKKQKAKLATFLRNPIFISHTIWFSILQLRFLYFIGSLNEHLNRALPGDTAAAVRLSNVCFYTMLGGFVSSFFSGIVYDWKKKQCKTGKTVKYREVMPAVLPLTITSILSVLLSVLVLVPVTELLYLIFVVMTIFRSFLYSLAAAFLNLNFPVEYFVMINGVMQICGGMTGAVQYVLYIWAAALPESAMHVDILLLCLCVLTFVHPLYLWIACLREEKQFNDATSVRTVTHL